MFQIIFDFVYSNLLYFSVAAVVLQFIHLWLYSGGKLKYAYPMALLVYANYLVVETVLGFASPEQIGILVFNIVNIWGMAMAIRGMRILKAGIDKDTIKVDKADTDKLMSLAKENNINIAFVT